MVLNKKIINGEEYLRISDLAEMADPNVSIRTIQRWIAKGELRTFLTVYQTSTGINYYRLGLPHEDDVLVDGSTFKYKLNEEVTDEIS